MSIQLAIATLQQYKICSKTKLLETNHPFEMKRRMAYVDNLILQLSQCTRHSNHNQLALVADDIRHCMLHDYYPLIQSEQEEDNFNFVHTLEDVEHLIDIETEDLAA